MTYTDKIYGNFEIKGIFQELINTSVFQRLTKIHQGGAIFLADPRMNHTRFDHSVGVMLLIRILNGSEEEQIAGLLHDISHTAFSHLIDYVLGYENEDYHETRYETVLTTPDIRTILQKYGFDYRLFIDPEKFKILEYPLPGLSADRIDYTLRDLFLLERIAKPEIDRFLNNLIVHNGRILSGNIENAEWFKSCYDDLVENYFNGRDNKRTANFMKSMISEYHRDGYLTMDDFHKDDFYIMEKIRQRTSKSLPELFTEWNKQTTFADHVKLKKRTIDPEILMGNKPVSLSALKKENQ